MQATRWWSLGAVVGLIAVSFGVVLSPPIDSASAAPGSYVPLDSPQRLLDTRTGTATADGQFAGIGRQAAGSTLTLRVGGRVGVPAGADAVVLNVTAVDPTDVGFLTVFPCGAGRPNASNINYAPSTNVANAVITKLGTNGDVCIYTFAATHLIADVGGYLPAGSYVPLGTPQRLLDTRAGAATADGQSAGIGPQAADSTLTLHVAGRVGLPGNVGVVVLNLTAVDPSDVGFLTMFPCGAGRPNASNLNYYAGTNVANTVIARTGSSGDVCIYTSTGTNLVVDVAGYLPAATYAPLGSPQRLLDSRPGAATGDGQFAGVGTQVAGTALQLPVAGRVGVPAGAGAVVLNVTAVDPTDAGFLTVSPTGAGQPNASNLNFDAGRNIANTVIAKVGKGGQICVYTPVAAHLVVDVAGYLPGPAAGTGGADCPSVPTGCANGGSYLWANLAACGWPSASNTGYPAGLGLKVTSGRTISTNNAVIDGEQINGSLTIAAQNVTVRNSLVNYSGSGGGGSGGIKILAGASATIDHVEVNGNSAVHACIWHEGAAMTVVAVHCHGSEDGIFAWAATGTASSGNNFTITDSYLHSFTAVEANGHVDGFQTEGAANGVIRHNTFDVPDSASGGISLWNSQKSTDNITVDDNLVTGGGFTVYAEDYSPSEANPVGGYTMTNVRFTNNKFSNRYSGCVGAFGVWFYRASSSWPYHGGPTGDWGANGNTRSGNTIIETHTNVDNGNPPGCT